MPRVEERSKIEDGSNIVYTTKRLRRRCRIAAPSNEGHYNQTGIQKIWIMEERNHSSTTS